MENVKDLYKMIEWNQKNGIQVLRVSSEMFPRATDEKCGYTIEFAKEELKKAGDLAKKYKHRLTFHPGQFNVIGTPNEKAFEATIKELSLHAEIYKYLGFEEEKDSVIVIHGGGLYGDKDETIQRWVINFGRLPKIVQQKLVLENCEKCYSIRDCLEISYKIEEKYGFALPVVVDSHHYQCYNYYHKEAKQESLEQLVEEASKTWKKRGIRMKCHVSEQGSGQVGHHSDYISELPQEFLSVPEKLGMELDILIEAKMKEQAIFFLYEIYPFLDLRSKEAKKNWESFSYKGVSQSELKKELSSRWKSQGSKKKEKTKLKSDCCDDDTDGSEEENNEEQKEESEKQNKKKTTKQQIKNQKNVKQNKDTQDLEVKIIEKQNKSDQVEKNKKKQQSDVDLLPSEKIVRRLRSGNKYTQVLDKTNTDNEDKLANQTLNQKSDDELQVYNFDRKKNKNLLKKAF
ncbi:UV damage endonuclease UvdE (macronuclear) [Tetrahymena thermophila SB210]|uniref:UV damage endonuclease UvdE n=1 Tax=Tetrahymena thermophila (strain SB210) TaxID=312017 RepID=Q23ZF3_TETTS|nr:UV damage endonuclease UvdE [Tetrahymena thermophila SB210]EAS01904.2 UV damage endonuclease UvdE [Tetrahymena thermophila SB210]|eukprot:XP_001022149.2 UV damage endonuclease UvdE [Tetrahymena thermophila SB210]